ncbi:MAG: prepilin-type N-terminal cleavage/methylation domain-containing protein [Planctomycetota bacterium]
MNRSVIASRAAARQSGVAPHGFTLVELLTVVTILGIVIAILVPALAGARNIAKKTSSQALLTDVRNAALRFESDNQRPPGRFTPAEMGNNTTGLTAMENVMIDLAGGVVGQPGGRTFEISPNPAAATPILVDLDRIGIETADNPGYFNPPKNAFKNDPEDDGTHDTVANGGGNHGQRTPADADASDAIRQLPELVDSFGQPVLAWVRDPIGKARGVPHLVTDFAAEFSVDGTPTFAYFYWQSNAGFLRSNALGEEGLDQTAQSLLNVTIDGGTTDRVAAIAALLGSTSFPTLQMGTGGTTDDPSDVNGLIPAAARGSVVFHSAGEDGVYLGINDEGAKQIQGQFLYRRNFFPGTDPVNRYEDENGNDTTIDILEGFDDLIVAGGG